MNTWPKKCKAQREKRIVYNTITRSCADLNHQRPGWEEEGVEGGGLRWD